MSSPDQPPTDNEPTEAPAATTKPVRYVFTCGSGPCQLSYEFENEPQPRKQRKLAPPEPERDQ